VEVGSAFDGVAFIGEGGASIVDDGVELLDCSDVLVDDGLVDARPERLGRLQFRCVRGKKNQAHAVGNVEPHLVMPTGVVDDEHDGSLAAGAGLFREARQQRREEAFQDAVMHIPDGLAAGRRDEGGDVEPIEAMMAVRDRPCAFGRPNASCEGLQAEPVLVAGEDLDRSIRISFCLFGDDRREIF